MVLGAPDRVNIPCPMHDTRLCQTDVKIYKSMEPKRCKYKTINTSNLVLGAARLSDNLRRISPAAM